VIESGGAPSQYISSREIFTEAFDAFLPANTVYATHDEVARLGNDLLAADYKVNIYSS
jgi:hypothetical protein